MAKNVVVRIQNGVAEFIYDDVLGPMLQGGGGKVSRASHVEPHPTKPGWLADMAPVGGPVIGRYGVDTYDPDVRDLEPFALREEALAAERDWLRRERGL